MFAACAAPDSACAVGRGVRVRLLRWRARNRAHHAPDSELRGFSGVFGVFSVIHEREWICLVSSEKPATSCAFSKVIRFCVTMRRRSGMSSLTYPSETFMPATRQRQSSAAGVPSIGGKGVPAPRAAGEEIRKRGLANEGGSRGERRLMPQVRGRAILRKKPYSGTRRRCAAPRYGDAHSARRPGVCDPGARARSSRLNSPLAARR